MAMKKQFTKEEKEAYFQRLRDRWNYAKNMSADEKQQAEAIILTHGLNVSYMGYYIVMLQLRAQHLDGIPYLDTKTFQGWKESGFMVRKGEKSTITGLTWISTKQGDAEPASDDKPERAFMFPKEYHLFHRSQVEPI